MRVKVLEARAGLADERYNLPDFSFRPGEEVELHDDLAAAWIESGIAAAVEEAEPAEAEPIRHSHHETKTKKTSHRK